MHTFSLSLCVHLYQVKMCARSFPFLFHWQWQWLLIEWAQLAIIRRTAALAAAVDKTAEAAAAKKLKEGGPTHFMCVSPALLISPRLLPHTLLDGVNKKRTERVVVVVSSALLICFLV